MLSTTSSASIKIVIFLNLPTASTATGRRKPISNAPTYPGKLRAPERAFCDVVRKAERRRPTQFDRQHDTAFHSAEMAVELGHRSDIDIMRMPAVLIFGQRGAPPNPEPSKNYDGPASVPVRRRLRMSVTSTNAHVASSAHRQCGLTSQTLSHDSVANEGFSPVSCGLTCIRECLVDIGNDGCWRSFTWSNRG